MDPLRCGAGEAGASTLCMKLCKQYEQKRFAPAFPCVRTEAEARSPGLFWKVVLRPHGAENIRKSWGLNSVLGQGSLRIPLRLVLRPAQEVRTSQETNKNLLPIT